MQGGLLLDVVLRKCAAILKLFTGKNQTLLICRDAFFSLDYAFALSLVSDASTSSVIV